MLDYRPEDPNKIEAFVCRSKYLNICQYPEELDYQNSVSIADEFVRVDSFIRNDTQTFELPKEFSAASKNNKLIYVSLGSMGSVDVNLMKRIVSVLATTPYYYIVSKGPLGDEYSLPRNCWGENYLPQTQILPLVDLVITHGGNNTTTESFSFGKPMIVMPLFGDQYDNAQRIHETGYGIRLETYGFKDEELIQAVDQLLNDADLDMKLDKAKHRIQLSNSKEQCCIKIEQIVEKFQKEKLSN